MSTEEEMEMSMVLDSGKSHKKRYDLDYESLSQAAIESLMAKDIDHITGILGLDVGFPLLLLSILDLYNYYLTRRLRLLFSSDTCHGTRNG